MHMLLPEWAPQDAVILGWPTNEMDWADNLGEVRACYTEIIKAICEHQAVILLCSTPEPLPQVLQEVGPFPLIVLDNFPLNDTWARDFGPLSLGGSQKTVLDFAFNAWGMKFPSNRDNMVVRTLWERSVFSPEVRLENALNFVFEGGAIETDGCGIGMTTLSVINESNRNPGIPIEVQQRYLEEALGLKHLYILDVLPLPGDDTDGHIDTLARFVDEHTIVYCHTADKNDPRWLPLQMLERELDKMRSANGEPYRCVPLPVPKTDWEACANNPLPATYANFLVINGAVLLPVYGVEEDETAIQLLQELFVDRKVIPILCSALVQQHGSLHCVTMQIPEGFTNTNLIQKNYEGRFNTTA